MPLEVGLGSQPRSVLPVLAGILLSALILGWLGIPVVSSEGMILRSHLIEGKIPRESGDPAWDKIPPMTLPLSGQVFTRPVWPEPTARALIIRSVHNGTDIAFRFEWEDNTKNDKLTPGTFRDGLAVGLPLGDAPAFFCMGQLDHYINIWHWKADWEYDIEMRAAQAKEGKKRKGPRIFKPIPRRKSSVEELIGGGFSTLTSKRRQGKVQGKATWNRGFWRVVIRRHLGTEDPANAARLEPGRLQVIAFAVWNGENQERNGQKAVSPWFQLAIDPIKTI